MADPAIIEALPWHQEAIASMPARDDLHHGLLFSGASGIGKREFAVDLARRLLCLQADPANCDRSCQSCQLFDAGTHPDLHVLCTERETAEGRIGLFAEYSNRYQDIAARDRRAKPSRVIPVDQIRLLIARLVQSSHISDSRVTIIVDADRMNGNAANALLKLLEEPPASSYLLLATAHPERLPATVRSRCLITVLPTPSREASLAWVASTNAEAGLQSRVADCLEQDKTGPIDLLEAVRSGQLENAARNADMIDGVAAGRNDPVVAAGVLSKQDPSSVLDWLQRWIATSIRAVTSERPDDGGSGVSLKGLFSLYGRVGRYNAMAEDQINLQLALEDILTDVNRLGGPVRKAK